MRRLKEYLVVPDYLLPIGTVSVIVMITVVLLIIYRRNRLKEDIIEAVECMKSWASDGPAGVMPFKDADQVQVMLEQLEAKGTGDRDRDRDRDRES